MTAVPNAARAYAALDLARAHRALNMGEWVDGPIDRVGLAELTAAEPCGTTACLAGWTAALAGYDVDSTGRVYLHGAKVGHVEYVAAELLGLTIGQAQNLFYATEYELDELVAEFFGPRPGPDGNVDYGTGCHCTTLGDGMPEHAPGALCPPAAPACAYPLAHPAHDFQLPDEDRDGEFGPVRQCAGVPDGAEMTPPPCADHEQSELSCPVCTAQRGAFYRALGRALGRELGDVPPNAGSAG